MVDRDLHNRVSLCLNSEGAPSLFLNGPDQSPRVELKTEDDGTPAVELRGSNRQNRISLLVEDSGSPHLLMWGDDRKVRADLTSESDGAANLLLNGPQGDKRVWLSVSPSGLPSVRLLDEHGGTAINMRYDTGSSELTFADLDGKSKVDLFASHTKSELSLDSPHQTRTASLSTSDTETFLLGSDDHGNSVRWPNTDSLRRVAQP